MKINSWLPPKNTLNFDIWDFLWDSALLEGCIQPWMDKMARYGPKDT